MSVKQIRLSLQARDQLIRLKSRTGIQQWNILCRWAFGLSLRETTPPTPVDIPSDSNVEMTWHVFGGEHHECAIEHTTLFKIIDERRHSLINWRQVGLDTTLDVIMVIPAPCG